MANMDLMQIGTELKKLQLQTHHSIKQTKTYLHDIGGLIETLNDKNNKKSTGLGLGLDLPSTTLENKPWSIQEYVASTNKINSSSSAIFSPSVQFSAYSSTNGDSDCDSSSSFDLYQLSEDMVDNNILNAYGYEIDSTITDTINGRIYLGKLMKTALDNGVQKKRRNRVNLAPSPLVTANYKMIFGVETSHAKQIVIKKYDKENGINTKGENIVKEAIILNYLTVSNNAPSNNICKFFDFIETDDAYYLLEEHCGEMTLDKFISIAHEYIKKKKLKVKHWRIIVKYLFWQLIMNLYWMHNDMKCVHLDLNDASNIMIQNVNFNENKKTGSVTIDSKNLSVSLVDFGQSELYPLDTKSEAMLCSKYGFTRDYSHKCPEQVKGEIFNGIKADMYACGMILFKMFTGILPYENPNIADAAYEALQNDIFSGYLLSNKSLKGINKNAMKLMVSLLSFDAKKRINTSDVIRNQWFTNYYIRYKYRIQQKSKSQKRRHVLQKHRYKLPYYSI